MFGDGAVYFGWIGSLIGLIAITGRRFATWGAIEKMGPALAVAMLTLFYGYMARLTAMTFTPLISQHTKEEHLKKQLNPIAPEYL